MDFTLLKTLLPFIEEYEKEYGNTDIKEFSVFLKNNVWDYEQDKEIIVDENIYRNYKTFPEVEFSTLITALYRFVKYYLKETFKPRKFKTLDEFGFLSTIFKEGSVLKNKLITMHLIEISSGSEIIKRLIRNGLVLEYPDSHDKRAKRVELTDLGKIEIIAAFNDMFNVAKLFKGNLSRKEFMYSLEALNKLNLFHWHIFKEGKHLSVKELVEKYIDQKQY